MKKQRDDLLVKISMVCVVVFTLMMFVFFFWFVFTVDLEPLAPGWYTTFNEWTFRDESGTVKDVTFPVQEDSVGDVWFETTLPDDLTDGTWLNITTGLNTTVYIDGEVVYEFLEDAVPLPGGAVKVIKVMIDLDAEDSGKSIVIYRHSEEDGNGYFRNVYIGDSLGIVAFYLAKDGPAFLASFVLILVTGTAFIASIIYYIIFKKRVKLQYLLLAECMTACWYMMDSELFQFVFGIYYVEGVLSYVVMLLMFIPYMLYLDLLMDRRYRKIFSIMCIYVVINYIVLMTLHFTGVLNITLSLAYVTGMYAVIIIVSVALLVKDMVKIRHSGYLPTMIGVVGMFMFAMVDLLLMNIVYDRTYGLMIILGLYFMLIMAVIQQQTENARYVRERDQAVIANASKSDFLAKMSHELRTPVNYIVGMNEMILRESKDEKISEYARGVEKSGKLLSDIINDVLDLSKIEAGKLVLTEVSYEVGELLYETISVLEESAEKKNLRVKLDIARNIPKVAVGDAPHIRQVLLNIFSNAVKYTSKGEIGFTAFVSEGLDSDKGMLYLSVSDSGIGIREEDKKYLFDPFVRLDYKKNINIQGSGLGLAIVKELVDMMDGMIMVDSVYGQGSTFTVVIPQRFETDERIGDWKEYASKAEKTKEVYHETFHAPDARILAVDDNRANLFVLGKLLEKTQMKIDMALSGEECLELCHTQKYDLIFMDHMMPAPDGVETLHLLKKMSSMADTPVVVLTANALPEMREYYLKEGFCDAVFKPVDYRELEKCIIKHIPDKCIISRAGDDEKAQEEHTDESGSEIRSLKDLIDYDRAIGRLGGSDEILQEVLKEVVGEGKNRIRRMRELATREDLKDYAVEAHAVKGIMATICADELSEHAKKHEFAGKENNRSYIEEDLENFLGEYETFISRLGEFIQP